MNELVASDPRNEKYFKTWGRPKEEPTTPGGTQPGGTADGVAVQEFAKLNNKLVDLVQGRQNAPALEAGQATPIVALVRELKTFVPQQQAAPDSLAVVDKVLTIADKLRPPSPPAPAANPLADMQGLVGLARDLKEIFLPETAVEKTAAARSRLDSWQEFTVAMTGQLSPILNPLAAVLAQALNQKLNGAGAQSLVGTPHPPPLNPSQPAAAQQPGQQPPGRPQSDGPVMMMPFLQMIGPPMVNYVRLIAAPEGIDPAELGADFASWVHEGFGANPLYDQAILAARSMGVIGIIAAFRATPLWTDKGPYGALPSLAEVEPKLPEFFTAFLNWQPAAETSEDEGEEEEADTELPPRVATFSETGL